MIRALVTFVALLGSVAIASAQPSPAAVGQVISIDVPGATAAYAVDQAIADITLTAGTVRVVGRQGGATKLMVVTGDSVQAYDLEFIAPRPAKAVTAGSRLTASTTWDSVYNSETDRLTVAVDSTTHSGARTTRLSAANVTRIGDTPSDDVRSSIASASFDVTSGARRVTLLDQLVRSSPLTLDGSRVRGLHYTDAAFDLHAGLSSPLLYRSVMLPTESDAVVGGRYTKRLGTLSFGPSLYWFPDVSRFGGAAGVAAGMRVQQATADGRFRVSAEGGYSRKAAAAADLFYDGARNHLSLNGNHRPTMYPSLGGVRPYGTSFDGQWTTRLSQRLVLNVATNGARQELPASDQRTGTSSAELRAGIGRDWTLTFGSNLGVFDNGTDRLTSITVPIGAGWEKSRGGVTGLFRYQQNTALNRGGAGGRVRAHAGIDRFAVSGYVDYQRDAATVGLVFRESPELGRLFAELGLQAGTPEDLARLLQEQDGLVSSGYLERTSLILNPRRIQTGVDATWSSRGNGTRLRFSLSANRVESTHGTGEHLLETLSFTRRITRMTEGMVSGTWWTSDLGLKAAGHWSFTVGLRLRGNSLTDLASWFRRDAIAGRVFGDAPENDQSAVKAPMPGVRVRLDDGREAVTDTEGRFRFAGVGAGARRVEALLPTTPGARFTTAANVVARPGEEAVFNIGYLAARLLGSVRDDAAAPIAGVHVLAKCTGGEKTAVSDSEGRYAINGPEGECRVGIDPASVPAGYEASTIPEQTVRLARETPARAEYVLPANRSLAGRVKAPGASMTVRLLETGAEQHTDSGGQFVFRNLKPGAYTILVEDTAGRRTQRVIVVPEGPAVVHVELLDDSSSW